MAQYQSRLLSGQQPSSFSLTGPEDRSLISAIKERYNRPGSPVLKVLSTLSIPEQVIASMYRESVERSKQPFAPKISMEQAALRGIAEPSTSYADVPGTGKTESIIKDIALDPMWLVGGALGKAGGIGAKASGRVLSKMIAKSPALDAAATRVMTKFVRNYDKARAGFKGYAEAVEYPARMAENEVSYQLVDKTAQDLQKLVPDLERRRHVLEIAEVIPSGISAKTIRKSGAFDKFKYAGFDLTDAEKEAVIMVRGKYGIVSALRAKYGIVPEEVQQALEERVKLTYIQRSIAQRDAIVADLDEALAKHPNWTAEDKAKVIKVREAIAGMEGYPNESYVREMLRVYRSGRGIRPGFTKFRKVEAAIKTLGESEDAGDQILYAMLEKDAARNLHQASTQTARAVYRKIYLDRFVAYMKKHGLLVKKEDIPNIPASLHGRGDRTLVEIKNVKELEDYYGPRVLVQDLHDMLMSPLDPERVKQAVGLTRRLNGWWRAWTIGPIPMTHVRNAVDSVVWRNAAGGMRIKDIGHIHKMGQIMQDAARGTLSVEDAALWKEMVRAGVVKSNWVDEARRMLAVGTEHKNVVAKWLDPTTSPPVQAGFAVGSKIEDLARGSMYLWKRANGASVIDAMKHVNKWHIDYRYGLTNFERKVRDNFVPFYTFTRFNMPLALETLVTQPRLLAAAEHAKETYDDSLGSPDLPLAGWMASGTPLTLKYDKGTGTYFIQMLDGWWSFTDVNKFVPGTAITELERMITPIISAPYEVIKNHKLWSEDIKIERPGDRFELYGAKINVPFGKRIENLLRVFRPINETDNWLKAASDKYGGAGIDRGVNVFNRMLFGKVYPTTREEQLKFYKAGTDDQLHALRVAIKRAEENNDTEMVDKLTEQVEAMEKVRKELGIK